MRSIPVNIGDTGTAQWADNLRADAYGGSQLLAHQQGTPNMTLYVEPGVVYIGTTRVIFGGGNSTTITAPTSHQRIDILTIDSSGTLAITQGTEATSPVVPSYPTNKAVLCEIYNRVGETSIKDADDTTNGYIYNDVRPIVAPVYISSSAQIANGTIVAANLNATLGLTATGMIFMWGGSSAPTGYIICDGSAISRTTYAALFSILGTTYGSGDGSTTFNVPNFQGNVPVGYKSGDPSFGSLGNTGGSKTNNHTHSLTYTYANVTFGGGLHGLVNQDSYTTSAPSDTNILQPYLVVNFIIKT